MSSLPDFHVGAPAAVFFQHVWQACNPPNHPTPHLGPASPPIRFSGGFHLLLVGIPPIPYVAPLQLKPPHCAPKHGWQADNPPYPPAPRLSPALPPIPYVSPLQPKHGWQADNPPYPPALRLSLASPPIRLSAPP
ncbi:hypothetical protein C8F04DRAFT_1251557 [Mycena alexandri]|uniref:Uncharacterized protein n=1 Tax=Mycena alexandri TaxID=1745969 RepID=A0AAD6TA99_9AGAR|nr:hypothetical protein C8F04DRAFT_1251557 [Mycena alexandri]